MSNAAKILSGPAGYAVPLIVGGILIYIVYRALKGPAQAAYTGAQSFDQNIGLGPFDAWVSSWFQPRDPGTP